MQDNSVETHIKNALFNLAALAKNSGLPIAEDLAALAEKIRTGPLGNA